MFIKPTKKWRSPEWDTSIMVPYTYYRLCESECDADAGSRQHTVLGLGELLESHTEMQKRELAELLTELLRIMSAQQRVIIVAEQTGRTTTQGAAMHGPGRETRGYPERPRHPCQTYLLNRICVAPEITIRRRPQL